MEFEGEALRQTGLALIGVAVFVAFLVVGSTMGGSTGTLVMVAGIPAFVVVMGALGLLFLEED